jgi:hypothetical protein
LRIVTITNPDSAKVEIFNLERGDLGPPPAGREGEEHDGAIADRDLRHRRPLERERRGEPLGGNRGAAVVMAGVFAPGALEQVAHHPLIGR